MIGKRFKRYLKWVFILSPLATIVVLHGYGVFSFELFVRPDLESDAENDAAVLPLLIKDIKQLRQNPYFTKIRPGGDASELLISIIPMLSSATKHAEIRPAKYSFWGENLNHSSHFWTQLEDTTIVAPWAKGQEDLPPYHTCFEVAAQGPTSESLRWFFQLQDYGYWDDPLEMMDLGRLGLNYEDVFSGTYLRDVGRFLLSLPQADINTIEAAEHVAWLMLTTEDALLQFLSRDLLRAAQWRREDLGLRRIISRDELLALRRTIFAFMALGGRTKVVPAHLEALRAVSVKTGTPTFPPYCVRADSAADLNVDLHGLVRPMDMLPKDLQAFQAGDDGCRGSALLFRKSMVFDERLNEGAKAFWSRGIQGDLAQKLYQEGVWFSEPLAALLHSITIITGLDLNYRRFVGGTILAIAHPDRQVLREYKIGPFSEYEVDRFDASSKDSNANGPEKDHSVDTGGP